MGIGKQLFTGLLVSHLSRLLYMPLWYGAIPLITEALEGLQIGPAQYAWEKFSAFFAKTSKLGVFT
jgi:hypothetical protein